MRSMGSRSNTWEMRNKVGAGKGTSLEMGQSLCEGTRSRCHSLTMFIAHALNYVCGGCLVPCWLHRMEEIPLSMGHVRLVQINPTPFIDYILFSAMGSI